MRQQMGYGSPPHTFYKFLPFHPIVTLQTGLLCSRGGPGLHAWRCGSVLWRALKSYVLRCDLPLFAGWPPCSFASCVCAHVLLLHAPVSCLQSRAYWLTLGVFFTLGSHIRLHIP